MVAEVARTHVTALTKGQPGRRYILGGENLTLKQILDKISALTGIPSPTVKIPFAVAATYAFLKKSVADDIRGKDPAPRSKIGIGRDLAHRAPGPAGARLPHPPRQSGDESGNRLVPRKGVCAVVVS